MLNFNNVRSNNRRISYLLMPEARRYDDLGDGLDIQIHSKNTRFVERIKDAYERLKENPIGIRLVEDIRSLRERVKQIHVGLLSVIQRMLGKRRYLGLMILVFCLK